MTDFTDVVVTVASDALLSWTLDIGTTRLASGTTPVTNAVLGTLDPTLLLNGLHEVRLSRHEVPCLADDDRRDGEGKRPAEEEEEREHAETAWAGADVEISAARILARPEAATGGE